MSERVKNGLFLIALLFGGALIARGIFNMTPVALGAECAVEGGECSRGECMMLSGRAVCTTLCENDESCPISMRCNQDHYCAPK